MNAGIFIAPTEPTVCWICGSQDKLTHEHKIKASDIRRVFGNQSVKVVADEQIRVAQGPKSKHLKFKSRICLNCNSAITQDADRAYDTLITALRDAGADFNDIEGALNRILIPASSSYLPTFRYFAKLLGCHLADFGAPIPTHLAAFVAGKTDTNCIWLRTSR